MAVLRPFPAIRPVESLAEKVAALPYDVMNSMEAREMVKGNPFSFLHIDKAEIDLDPSVNLYDKCVYRKAAENLNRMIEEHVYFKEEKPCYYIYRQIMDGRSQAGIVGCASIDDYLDNRIKKHELTVASKEEDRVRHVDICNANTGPIFLTYRNRADITQILYTWMEEHHPVYDFVSEDEIAHTVWVIDDEALILTIAKLFQSVPELYIADGHHRTASAVRVGQKRRSEHPDYTGDEEFNYFLAVLFPDEELSILDYNRVLKEWNGYTRDSLLARLEEVFIIETMGEQEYKPTKVHEMGMYLSGQWYRLTVKDGLYDEKNPVERLDVSILQNTVLSPVFNIENPRTDKRIKFVGGIRGLAELKHMVDDGMCCAFAMYPTSVQDLMDIADSGNIMPPKSTWFEPKLRSGIFIHQLTDCYECDMAHTKAWSLETIRSE